MGSRPSSSLAEGGGDLLPLLWPMGDDGCRSLWLGRLRRPSSSNSNGIWPAVEHEEGKWGWTVQEAPVQAELLLPGYTRPDTHLLANSRCPVEKNWAHQGPLWQDMTCSQVQKREILGASGYSNKDMSQHLWENGIKNAFILKKKCEDMYTHIHLPVVFLKTHGKYKLWKKLGFDFMAPNKLIF